MSGNVVHISKKIEKQNDRKALGYESTMDFNLGYLSALLEFDLISRKEYYALKKVYANWENGDCYWFINKEGEVEIDPEGEPTKY